MTSNSMSFCNWIGHEPDDIRHESKVCEKGICRQSLVIVGILDRKELRQKQGILEIIVFDPITRRNPIESLFI